MHELKLICHAEIDAGLVAGKVFSYAGMIGALMLVHKMIIITATKKVLMIGHLSIREL